jgi:hypothetical protein
VSWSGRDRVPGVRLRTLPCCFIQVQRVRLIPLLLSHPIQVITESSGLCARANSRARASFADVADAQARVETWFRGEGRDVRAWRHPRELAKPS